MNTTTITIPIPPSVLGGNARGNWKPRHFAGRKQKRQAVEQVMLARAIGKLWRKATLQATFYHKAKRRRDQTNMQQSLKGAIDGLVEARLILDDSAGTLVEMPPVFKIDKTNPRVEITIARAD